MIEKVGEEVTYTVKAKCDICGEIMVLHLTEGEYRNFERGFLPYNVAHLRFTVRRNRRGLKEVLDLCPKCFNKLEPEIKALAKAIKELRGEKEELKIVDSMFDVLGPPQT